MLISSGVLPGMFGNMVLTGRLLGDKHTRGTDRTTGVTKVSEDTFCGCGSCIFGCSSGTGGAIALFTHVTSGTNVLSILAASLCGCDTGVLAIGRDIPRGNMTSISVAMGAGSLALPISRVLSRVGDVSKIVSVGVWARSFR